MVQKRFRQGCLITGHLSGGFGPSGLSHTPSIVVSTCAEDVSHLKNVDHLCKSLMLFQNVSSAKVS